MVELLDGGDEAGGAADGLGVPGLDVVDIVVVEERHALRSGANHVSRVLGRLKIRNKNELIGFLILKSELIRPFAYFRGCRNHIA